MEVHLIEPGWSLKIRFEKEMYRRKIIEKLREEEKNNGKNGNLVSIKGKMRPTKH